MFEMSENIYNFHILMRCLVSFVEYVNLAEARILLDSTGMTNISFPDAKRAEFTRWVWNKIQENGMPSV